MLHMHTHSHTLAAPGAPDEEGVHLQIVSLHGEHVANRLGWTLLERVWAMEHTIWLPKPPPMGCNIWAYDPNGSKPDTRMCEGQRLSSDIDARAHPTVEQDAQAASAALLKGEEKRMLSVSSKQAAVPGTPSTFDTPSLPLTAIPANSEATPQPYRHTCMRTPKPSCTAHNFQTRRVVHLGTSPPSPRAQPAHLWGL